jgi:hypothetical protein
MNEIRLVTSPVSDEVDVSSATAYPELITPDVVSLYLELGLDPAFTAILGRHIQDLHLVGEGGVDSSYLTVSGHHEETVQWHREAVISLPQLSQYMAIMRTGFNGLDDSLKAGSTEFQQKLLRKLGVDWILYELTADAAAASCYMQYRFDKYSTTFNGQDANWRADLRISDEYLTQHAGERPPNRAIEIDHEDFRSGIASILLKDSILRSDLFAKDEAVEWLMNSVRVNYPSRIEHRKHAEPYKRSEIILRLSGMAVHDLRPSLDQYLAVLDEQLDGVDWE